MKLTIEPTPVMTTIDGTPCRQWVGATDGGIPVFVFVAAVGVSDDIPAADRAAFERELAACLPRIGASALLVMKEPDPSGREN